MKVHTLNLVAALSLTVGASFGTYAAVAAEPSVSFDRITFTDPALDEKPVSVSRKSCYKGTTSSYLTHDGKTVVAANGKILAILKGACKYNPRDYGQLGGYFINKDNLWDSQYTAR